MSPLYHNYQARHSPTTRPPSSADSKAAYAQNRLHDNFGRPGIFRHYNHHAYLVKSHSYSHPRRRGSGYHRSSNHHERPERPEFSNLYYDARISTADEFFEGASEVKLHDGSTYGYQRRHWRASEESRHRSDSRRNIYSRNSSEWELKRRNSEDGRSRKEATKGGILKQEYQALISLQSDVFAPEKSGNRRYEEGGVKEKAYILLGPRNIKREHEYPLEDLDTDYVMSDVPVSPIHDVDCFMTDTPLLLLPDDDDALLLSSTSPIDETQLLPELNSIIQQQRTHLAAILPVLHSGIEDLLAKQAVLCDLKTCTGTSWSRFNKVNGDFTKIAEEEEELLARENCENEIGGTEKTAQLVETGNFKKTKVYACATEGPAAGVGRVYWV